MTSRKRVLAFLLAPLVPGVAAAASAPAMLGQYGVDPAKVTVSGLSSGGYMAVQLGVAYSSTYSGTGVIAAGPYACAYTGGSAAANINRALGPCMAGGYSWVQRWQCLFFLATCAGTGGPDAAGSVGIAQRYAKQQAIDSLAGLKRQRIFLLSGTKDTKVDRTVVDALDAFYSALVPKANIRHETLDGAAHTFPTDTFSKGNRCSSSDSPHVSDCKYDGAGRLLAHLYGALKPYNRWADTNRIVVLYPQVRKSASAFGANPENCWDWWGYTGPAWLEKRAPQMTTIAAMVHRLTSKP